MKAIELAKVLYPSMSNQDIIELTCPDNLLLVDKIKCDKTKEYVDDECIKCWEQEISKERADWLISYKKIADLF